MILDTSFLIDVQRDTPRAVEKVMDIEASERPKRIPLVAVYELFVGVGKGTRTEANRVGSSESSATFRSHRSPSR